MTRRWARRTLSGWILTALALAPPAARAQEAKKDNPPAADEAARREAREIRAAIEELRDALKKAGRPSRAPAAAPAPPAPRATTGLVPLPDLGTGRYKGQEGGHYPGGSNTPPTAHQEAGLRLAREVRPLDREGRPDPEGKIVLLSLGMSNTTQEFSAFQALAAGERLNPRLVLVDGAQGGMTAAIISAPESPRGRQFWQTVQERLGRAGVTPAQVQAAWIKEADARPTEPFPGYSNQLKRELAAAVRLAKERFPNLHLAYLSNRTYGGYATTPLNPEPFAYESGFAVKWLIADQIEGKSNLNFNPEKGPVVAPWLAWGPDLWADGTAPREGDGLSYAREDFGPDGTHPSPAGRQKVARLLLDFFRTDPTARPWFAAEGR